MGSGCGGQFTVGGGKIISCANFVPFIIAAIAKFNHFSWFTLQLHSCDSELDLAHERTRAKLVQVQPLNWLGAVKRKCSPRKNRATQFLN